MANTDHEHTHNKAKIVGEIGLGAAILGGIAVAGLHIRKVRTAKDRHMSHLGAFFAGEQTRDLPPLKDRLSLFGYDQDGEPTKQTLVAGLIYHLSTKFYAEKAFASTELQKLLNLPENNLDLILRNLYQDGFFEVEAEEVAYPQANERVFYLTASGDLVKAETMSVPLAMAVSEWASRAATAGLQTLEEQQYPEQ